MRPHKFKTKFGVIMANTKNYIAIARPSHWIKNLFVIPGFIAALMFEPQFSAINFLKLFIVLISTSFIASANYVINEWLDAKSDAHHPLKKNRPSVIGSVFLREIVILYISLSVLGLAASALISKTLLYIQLFFLFMGIIYNVPPARLKDLPYLDVLSESINNPIRLLAGWYCVVDSPVPPLSLILGYWLGGAFLMNVKRYAELRTLTTKEAAINYRKSFEFYTAEKLLTISLFYSMLSFFFIAIFTIRYRVEYLFVAPFLAYLYISYFNLGMQSGNVAESPERLYKEKKLLVLLFSIIFLYFVFSIVNVELLGNLIKPLNV